MRPLLVLLAAGLSLLPGIATATPTSEPVVIGQDERLPVVDTTVFPFSAIAYLELEDAYGDVVGSCTGTFIGPDALLTAGHCLWDSASDDWTAENIRVVPGKDADYEPFGFEYAEDWWVPDQFALSGLSEWDWGLVKLPDELLALDTGWMTVMAADSSVLSASGFAPAIVGYPSDKPAGTMWGLIRPAFESITDFELFYDIDTAPGQSGSAIWSASEGPYLGRIVGIHTQGGALNSGSRIDLELLDDLSTGCRAMGCTIAREDAPQQPQPPLPPQPPGPPSPPPPVQLPYRSVGVAIARD